MAIVVVVAHIRRVWRGKQKISSSIRSESIVADRRRERSSFVVRRVLVYFVDLIKRNWRECVRTCSTFLIIYLKFVFLKFKKKMSSLTRNLKFLSRNIIFPKNYLKSSVYLKNEQMRRFHLTPALDKIVSFNLSDIGEGIREVVVKEWFVKVGDKVQQFDTLCEVQSDKASVTITSRYDGTIVKLHKNVEEIALVGNPLVDFDVEEDEEDGSESSSSSDDEKKEVPLKEEVVTSPNASESKKILTTPAVRRIAMENKVNLADVTPTGKNGRLLKGDVMEFLGQVPPGTNVPHPTIAHLPTKQAPVQAVQPQVLPDRVEKLLGVRKAMYNAMTESLKIPHFAYSDEVDMTKLIEFREQLKEEALKRGTGNLTFMPFFIKAASIALTAYPILNSSIDLENESIIYKSAHNISIAMDTTQGLVVPNIKNCQCKTILDISKELNDLIARGRQGKLTPNDFANGTFSLSNIGIVGGTYTHPVIVPPQVSIGAMGRTKIEPRFDAQGNLTKAHVMSVSWTADHRVIDGVTMASFSNIWKRYLEHPALFILDMDK